MSDGGTGPFVRSVPRGRSTRGKRAEGPVDLAIETGFVDAQETGERGVIIEFAGGEAFGVLDVKGAGSCSWMAML